MKRRSKKDTVEPTLYSVDKTKRLIQEGSFPLVFAPWNGKALPVQLYIPNAIQLKACGNFSIFSSEVKEAQIESDIQVLIDLKNAQEKVLQTVLVSPTYEEIINHVSDNAFIQKQKKRQKELRAKVDSSKPKTREEHAEKNRLSLELDELDIMLGFLFPDDFAGYVCMYVIQKDRTDVDRLSEAMLLEAGFRAKAHGGRPSAYTPGTFTEYIRLLIDDRADALVADYLEKKKLEKKSGFEWIGKRS